jgi:hypothetical protein
MTSHTLKIRELKEELFLQFGSFSLQKVKEGRIRLQKVGEENNRKTLVSSQF